MFRDVRLSAIHCVIAGNLTCGEFVDSLCVSGITTSVNGSACRGRALSKHAAAPVSANSAFALCPAPLKTTSPLLLIRMPEYRRRTRAAQPARDADSRREP
jgi:hypothetical protein